MAGLAVAGGDGASGVAFATKRNLRSSSPSPTVQHASALTAALWKLDPRCWNGNYDGWRYLMNACKAAGISAEEFAQWSVQDPDYANDADEIVQLWAMHRQNIAVRCLLH